MYMTCGPIKIYKATIVRVPRRMIIIIIIIVYARYNNIWNYIMYNIIPTDRRKIKPFAVPKANTPFRFYIIYYCTKNVRRVCSILLTMTCSHTRMQLDPLRPPDPRVLTYNPPHPTTGPKTPVSCRLWSIPSRSRVCIFVCRLFKSPVANKSHGPQTSVPAARGPLFLSLHINDIFFL